MNETKVRDARSRISRALTDDLQDSQRWSFHFADDRWSCALKQIQCLHTVTQQRCKRITTYPLGYCWQHMKTDLNIRIGRTTMQDASGNRYDFQGLFACDPNQANGLPVFRKGNIIAPYIGLEEKVEEKRYTEDETAPYMLKMRGHTTDAACARGIGSFANTCSKKLNRNCKTNAAFHEAGHANFPVIRATAMIRNGDEIFVSYGASYFAQKSIHMPFETFPLRPRREHVCRVHHQPRGVSIYGPSLSKIKGMLSVEAKTQIGNILLRFSEWLQVNNIEQVTTTGELKQVIETALPRKLVKGGKRAIKKKQPEFFSVYTVRNLHLPSAALKKKVMSLLEYVAQAIIESAEDVTLSRNRKRITAQDVRQAMRENKRLENLV